jgi:restriction endonuclease S subunit
MITTLKDIAQVRPGYPFRGKIEHAAEGQYGVVQIKDIAPDDRISFDNLVRTDLPNVKSGFVLRPGDVLFIARGTRSRAAVFEGVADPMIAGAQFFILQPNLDTILPEFLAWYINQAPAQQYLEKAAVGSNVRLITKEALGQMPVPVLPLATQHRIVAVYQLQVEEQRLLEAIKQRRNKLIELALLKSLNDNQH